MKRWMVLGWLAVAAACGAQEVTLVSAVPDRPVFNYTVGPVVQTRTVAPGQRLRLEPGRFSGLGLKQVPLEAGVYYLARVNGHDGLYRLADGQTLILNASGRALPVALAGTTEVAAVLAAGTPALGKAGSGPLRVEWDDNGQVQSQLVEPGRVYRLVLASPEGGVGTSIALTAWD